MHPFLRRQGCFKSEAILKISERTRIGLKKRMTHSLTGQLKNDILDFCEEIAGPRKVIAACVHGPQACGYADTVNTANVLLLLGAYSEGLKHHARSLKGFDLFMLVVDRRIFERDVTEGWLGEFAAEKITFPYEPLINKEYLHHQEVSVKRRIVRELLENLVSEFSELSQELLIKPKYFMYETIRRRAKLFPPITYSFLNMFREDLKGRNVEAIMSGYREAMRQLAEENWITHFDGYIKVSKKLIEAVRHQKIRIPPVLRSIQKKALLHILNIFPKITRLLQNRRSYHDSRRKVNAEKLVFQLEDPEKYLLIPTPTGSVPLSDRTTLESFVERMKSNKGVWDVRVDKLGGALNTVYLLKINKNGEEKKVTMKKFEDWFGFKWFPLALWTMGTKTFAVRGRSRLEREYAINQFLRSQGFPVPEILHISHKERLIVKNFIEGENLVEIIKRIVSTKEKNSDLSFVREVGIKTAKAHQLGVSLGDCKPENIVITEEGEVYFLDLEQASRNGDQAWDIAEFLYYSGHYISPIAPADSAELIATEFIQGYLDSGGAGETVEKAGSPRYTKVFSIFTPPHVLLLVSKLCQKMSS